MDWKEQVEKEIKLNLSNQVIPSIENIDLMIDFLYGGCLDEILNDLRTIGEDR